VLPPQLSSSRCYEGRNLSGALSIPNPADLSVILSGSGTRRGGRGVRGSPAGPGPAGRRSRAPRGEAIDSGACSLGPRCWSCSSASPAPGSRDEPA
jgi:hypothetical protein